MRKFLQLLTLLVISLPVFSQNQYYVSSTSGNDANLGTSSGAPWKTLQKAISSFTLSSAGALVHVAGGNYNYTGGQSCVQGERPSVCISRGGASSAAPLVLQCDSKWTVPSSTGNGCKVTSTSNVIMSLGAANWVTIKGGWEFTGANIDIAVITGCDGNNPTTATGTCPNGNGLVVDGVYIHDVGQTSGCPSTGAVFVGPLNHGAAASYSSPPIIRNNRFQHIGNLALARKNGGTCNQYHAVYANTPGVRIQNNLFLDVVSFSIHFYSQPCKGVITNNTVVRDGAQGIIYGGGDCSALGQQAGLGTITDNISIDSGQQNIATGVSSVSCTPGTPNLLSNNVTGGPGGDYAQTSSCSNPVNAFNGVTGAQLFVNYLGSASTSNGNDDLHLRGSAVAVAHGITTCVANGITPCMSTTDFDGKTWNSTRSVGAYEYAPAPSSPPGTPTNLQVTVN